MDLFLAPRSKLALKVLATGFAAYLFIVLLIENGIPAGFGVTLGLGIVVIGSLWGLFLLVDLLLDTQLPSFYAQLRREVAAFFTTPIPYFVLFLFILLSGLSFWNALAQTGAITMQFAFLGTIQMGWFLIPLLTMGLFAQERNDGTIETLMTAPISDAGVTVAKFSAAVCFYIAMLLPTLVYWMLLRNIGQEIGKPDTGPVISTYVGMVLTGCFFIAIGLFTSATTGSQILAALLAWVVMLLLVQADGIARMLNVRGTWVGDALEYLEPNQNHLAPFFRGVIDPKNVLFFLSFILFFLFLSVRSIEARKWR
jgi:ABC-2 type transport system permease protein